MANMFAVQEWQRDGYVVSTADGRLQLDVIHHFLSQESYWAEGIRKETVARSLQYSLPFGVYAVGENSEEQVGLARVTTDYTTFGYIGDVFIVKAHQGRGLGKWLMTCILAHPELQTLRRWALYTRDAHGLYTQFGFVVNPKPENHLVKQQKLQ